MHRDARLATVSAAVVLAVAMACAEPPDVPICEPLIADAIVVRNNGPGVWERDGRVPTPVELWRRGGTNEGEELASPLFPAASRAGRLAIPDFQLGEVTVIAPDGTWLGPWARQGRGPGEIAIPVAVAWTSGDTLAVFDISRSMVVRLEDGEPAGDEIRVDPTFVAPVVRAGQLAWAGLHPDGTVLLDPGWSSGVRPEGTGVRSSLIVRLAPGAASIDTVARADIPVVGTETRREWPVPGWPRPSAATGTDGALVWGGADGTYRLVVERAGEMPPLQICRAAPPLPLSAAERGDSVPEGLEALGAAIRDAEPPPAPAAFGRLVLGAAGRVWVQRERPPAFPPAFLGRHGARYDVFAPDGTYLGEVRMPPRATLHAARGDTVWAYENGEYDETWVVAYRLALAPAGASPSARGGS